MGYGHSLDLRGRIIEAVKSGSSAREASRRFDVSHSSAIKLVRRWRESGSYAPGQVGGQKKRRLAGHEDWLHGVMAAEPDITLLELQDRLAAMGVAISRQAINNMLHVLGYSFKKKQRTRRNGSAPISCASAITGVIGNTG